MTCRCSCGLGLSIVPGGFVNPWTVVHLTSLTTGFSRRECWSRLPCPPPGELPATNLHPLRLLHWQADSLQLVPPGSPTYVSLTISPPPDPLVTPPPPAPAHCEQGEDGVFGLLCGEGAHGPPSCMRDSGRCILIRRVS